MPTMQIPLPKAEDIDELNTEEFLDNARRRVELYELKKSIEAEIDDLNVALSADLLASGNKSVNYDGHQLSVIESEGRMTLKRELLLQNGVDASVIAASMTKSLPYTTLAVKPIKGGSDAESE